MNADFRETAEPGISGRKMRTEQWTSWQADEVETWAGVIELDRNSQILFRNEMRVDGLGSSNLSRTARGSLRMMAQRQSATEAAINGSALPVHFEEETPSKRPGR